jgi:hypothetical protein
VTAFSIAAVVVTHAVAILIDKVVTHAVAVLIHELSAPELALTGLRVVVLLIEPPAACKAFSGHLAAFVTHAVAVLVHELSAPELALTGPRGVALLVESPAARKAFSDRLAADIAQSVAVPVYQSHRGQTIILRALSQGYPGDRDRP